MTPTTPPSDKGMFGRAFARFGYSKNIDRLLAEASDEKKGLAKTLTAKDLVILGVAGIIGAGIFVLIGQGIQVAGGIGVIFAFVVAASICAVAGLAYAELASSVPASGSAYAYIYTVMGELPGWLVAWALVLEYAVGAVAVAVGWRNNLLAVINQFKDSDTSTDIFSDPDRAWLYRFTHSPFEHVDVTADGITTTLTGWINVPSVLIVLIVTALLVRGTKESARFTFVLVAIKVTILLLAIVGGFMAFSAANFDDPWPHSLADDPNTEVVGDAVSHADTRSIWGATQAIFAGAAIMFFAYIGFDSVSTTAEETKNPKKDMPRGILGSLFITTLLYVVAAFALSSAAHWTTFMGDSVQATNARGEPFGYVFEKNGFLEVGDFALGALLIRIGALVGTTSVLLVLILGGVRVFFNMSRDGLLPAPLARISQRGTPAFGTIFYGAFTAVFAALLSLGKAVNLVNIGTLFAFFMVILAVWVFRAKRPDIERPFRMQMGTLGKTARGTPIFPVITILGLLGTLALIISLDSFTLKASLAWTGLGLLFYALYSIRNSKEAHDRHGGGPTDAPSLTLGVTRDEDRAPGKVNRAETTAWVTGKLEKGDVPILDIEGVGPVFAEKLEAHGIRTAYQLRGKDADDLAAATGIPAGNLRTWQTMADLLPVHGVGPQYAEVLARTGVASVDDLASRDAATLTKAINRFLKSKDVTIVGVDVTEKRVAGWIAEARKTSAKPAPKSAGGAYKHNGFTLYAREADGRTLYFFARNEPKSGVASALPTGYEVGENSRTGLPFLRRSA